MAGFQAFLTFFISFAVVALVTPPVRRYALRWKLGDKPNGRKIHTSTIPHIGGIAIVLGAAAGLGAISLMGLADRSLFLKILLPVGLVVALGLTDDMKSLKARQKLTVQVVVALLLASVGVNLFIGLPVFDNSLVFVVLFSSFYLVGISSSVNLIDGHDGLAAGLCLISAAAFAVIALLGSAPLPLAISLSIAGACGGFLLYNFPPGKIFMGDTGSMFLGLMLGIVACLITALQPSVNTFVGVCFVLSVPMTDALLAIARRLVLRRPIFQADCRHVHHMLVAFGFSARETLFILYGMQAVMALMGVLVMRGSNVPLILGLVILALLFATFFRVMVGSKERTERPGVVPPKLATNSVPSLEK